MKRTSVGILWLFAVLVLLVFVLYVISRRRTHENMENDTKHAVEIVVSRYNEDLAWLKEEPFAKYPVTIYNKGTDDAFTQPTLLTETVNVPNVGVNVHTILYHIVHHYDHLSDVTVFLPGSCMDAHKGRKTLQTVRLVEQTNNSVFVVDKLHRDQTVGQEFYNFTLDTWANTNPQNRALNPESALKQCDIRPFGAWYAHFFPNMDVYSVNFYVMFAVSREHILQRSKASYEELLAQVDTDKNEESAHYFERAFLAVFHPIPQECLFLPE